ncbi:MAG: thymidylate kinase [Thermoplasmatota archaeon]
MKLIIIDGCDASGKDTHALKLKEMFDNEDKIVKIRSHPEEDNIFGKIAKNALLKDGMVNKLKASVFYTLDVLRSLNKYYDPEEIDVLIMVRYLMGTAYLPKPFSKISYKIFKKILPTSDYMFFLDVDPEDAMERLNKRQNRETFENFKDLCRVRNKVFSIIDGEWHIIDSSRPIYETALEIKEILRGD